MDLFNRKEKAKQKAIDQQAAVKASLGDDIEALKEKIKQLERQALRLKKEHDSTAGGSKRTISRQIQQVFDDIDQMRGQENILMTKMAHVSRHEAMGEEIRIIDESQSVDADKMDDRAAELEIGHEGLRDSDRVHADSEKVVYENPNMSKVDNDERLAEIGENQDTNTADLPSEIEERLSQLEIEED